MEKDLYTILTNRIDQFFVELKQTNLFYQRIFSGAITVPEIALFIKNVTYLTAHTPAHLTLAIQATSDKKMSKLNKYFKAKHREEVGHDQWGESDLKQINERFKPDQKNPDVIPEMVNFVKANEQTIQTDPYLYFVYILFAEYYTVIAGPECLDAIERLSQVPRDMMSIIDKHAELDKDHVHDWSQQARIIGLDPERAPYYLAALEKVMKNYALFAQALSRSHAKVA